MIGWFERAVEIGDDDFERLSRGRDGVGKGMTILLAGYARLADVRDVSMLCFVKLEALGLVAVYHLPDPVLASVTAAAMEEMESDGRLVASSESGLSDGDGLAVQVADVTLVRRGHESFASLHEIDALGFKRNLHGVVLGSWG